jgi:hypothetical protein
MIDGINIGDRCINCILAVIAALLLPAGLVVFRSARSKTPVPGE